MASEFVPTRRFLAVDGYLPGSAILEPALADRRRALESLVRHGSGESFAPK